MSNFSIFRKNSNILFLKNKFLKIFEDLLTMT